MSVPTAGWPRGTRVAEVIALCPAGPAWTVSRVTRSGRLLRVQPLGRIPGDARGVSDELRAAAAAPGAWGVLGLPAMEVVARRLDAPFSDLAKARLVLPSLLEGHLPFALEKCLLELLDLRRAPNGHVSALAVAARRDEVDRHLAVCAAAGLSAAVVDAEGLALWRQAAREVRADPARPHRVVAYVSVEHVTLVVGRQGELQDVLVFKTTAASPGAAVEEQAELARRVQRRWRSLAPEWAEVAQEWLWCGPALDGAAVDTLTRRLAPAAAEPRRLPDDATLLERALAAPLLLDGRPALNLLPLDAEPVALGRSRHALERRVALSWLAAAAGLFAAVAAWKIGLARHAGEQRARALDAYQEIAGAPCPQPELVQVLAPRALEDLRVALNAFQPSAGSFSDDLRDLLSAAHEQGLQADRLERVAGGLRIQGVAQSPRDAAALVERLSARGRKVSAVVVPAGRWAVVMGESR